MPTSFNHQHNSAFADPKEARRLERKVKTLCLLCRRKSEFNFLLVIVAFMLSAGFLFANGFNQNYELIYQAMPQTMWSCTFFIYGALKLHQVYFRTSKTVKYVVGLIGIWLWTFMFLSFSVFDSTPIAPAEVLITIFALVEGWILISVVDICIERRHSKDQHNAADIKTVFFRQREQG